MNVNPHMRFLKCQAHTAQHLISALVESIYGVQTVSHHVGTDECYVEFDLRDFNKKMAIELQVTCNGLIRDDLDVTILYPSQKDATAVSQQEAAKRGYPPGAHRQSGCDTVRMHACAFAAVSADGADHRL